MIVFLLLNGYAIAQNPLQVQTGPQIFGGGYNISCIGGNNGRINTQVTGGVPPYTYQLSHSSQTTLIYNAACEGFYTLNLLNSKGCKLSTSTFITTPKANNWNLTGNINSDPASQLKTAYSLYIKDNTVTGIDANELEIGVNLYPNPTNNQFTMDFDLPNSSEVSLEIFDAKGSVVASYNLGNLPSGFQSINLNISNLSNGLYLCNIKAGSAKFTKRIIKN